MAEPAPATSSSTQPPAGSPAPAAAPDPSTLPPEALALASRLFDFARQGFTEHLAAYLDSGVSPNLTNSAGDTLLMLAAYHNRLPTVRLLVARGADVDAVNDKGQSILAGAVFKGWAEVVGALVEAGADPDRGQPSPRDCAVMFRRPDLMEILDRGKGGGPAADGAAADGAAA